MGQPALKIREVYSFETATIIASAEIVEYCTRMATLIEHGRSGLQGLLLDERSPVISELVDESTSQLTDLHDLINKLQVPVDMGMLAISNEFAPSEERPPFSLHDLQSLYGTKRCQEIGVALSNFETLRSTEAREVLLEALQACQQDLKDRIECFGGDTEVRVAGVTQGLKLTTPDSSSEGSGSDHLSQACNWHGLIFRNAELSILNRVISDVRRIFTILEPNILDLGCGDFRIAEVLMQLYKRVDSNGKVHEFYLPNLKGVEYAPNTAVAARARKKTLLEKLGKGDLFNPNDVMVADFFENAALFEPNSFHLITSLMRTIFHGLTRKKLSKFLKAASKALLPGGILLVDTLAVKPSLRVNAVDKSRLKDLINIYGIFSDRLINKYQSFMPQGIDLRKTSRRQIADNTAGRLIQSEEEFYPREVITVEYLRYIIKEYNLDFEVEEVVYESVNNEVTEMNMDPALIALGRKWIKDNLLEDHYKNEVSTRLADGGIDPWILEITQQDPEKIIDYIAYHMVLNYPAAHLILTKKKDEKKKDTKVNKGAEVKKR